MDSLVLDTVIGIVFVFAVFAVAVSALVEALNRLIGLRAEFLLRGISSLLNADTKFDKDWLPRLVAEAEKLQDQATGTTLDESLTAVDDTTTEVAERDKVKEALEAAKQLVELWTEVDIAEAALAAAETQLKTAENANNKEAVKTAKAAVETARRDLRTAQSTVDERRLTGPDKGKLDDATAKLKAADEALAAEEQTIAGLATSNPDLAGKKEALATARELLAPARHANQDVPSAKSAISVVTVMTQPVVDLTAALEVPERLGIKSPSRNTKRKLPSYISARTFSRALIRTLVPDPKDGKTTGDQLKSEIDKLGDSKLKEVLSGHLDAANKDVVEFREEIEKWYDDHMERVSGWYKRHTRWWLLAVGALLAIGSNVNAVAMSQAFYSDQALRESVVKLAFDESSCKADTEPADCLQAVRGEIDDLRGAGLPIGWGKVAYCQEDVNSCNWSEAIGLTDPDSSDFWADALQVFLVLLGWAVIALSAILGARFWFDLLSKMNSIRSAGRKPESSTA